MSRLYEYGLSTGRAGFYNITGQVRESIAQSGAQCGLCVVYCPHTTAGITVNENADPDVARDMLLGLAEAYPDRAEFRHFEGNSAAHLRASALGCSQTLVIEAGQPLLGRWQGIYFCEFDGPRQRRFYVRVLADG